MEKHKVCMLGATGVGKTSLVSRFARSIFSEVYLTTVGVKIELCEVEREARRVTLVLWDLSGEDEFQRVRLEYLRGASGYLLVIDGTRRETIETAVALQSAAHEVVGEVPFVVVLNKADLLASWDLDEQDQERLAKRGWKVMKASAKTGAGVKDAFDSLVDAIPRG